MPNHESRQERDETKEIRRFVNKLQENNYHWVYSGQENGKEELIDSSLALKIISGAVEKEGYMVGLGNLEDTLLNIALASSPDSNLFMLNNNYRIKDHSLPEEILSTFELLAIELGSFNDNLKRAYLKNLELFYSNIIRGCTQEYECINNQLLEAEQRASILGIDKEQLQKFRKNMESWAYIPETEA